jgi:hypothetical protein
VSHLRERASELSAELGARRERHVEQMIDEPSAEIRDALGERPREGIRPSPVGSWRARAIAEYRFDPAPAGGRSETSRVAKAPETGPQRAGSAAVARRLGRRGTR